MPVAEVVDSGLKADGGKGGSGQPDAGFISAASFCEKRRSAWCELRTRCRLFTDLDACLRSDAQTTQTCPDFTREIDAGITLFQVEEALACLSALNAGQACTFPSSCSGVVAGVLSEGESCYSDGPRCALNSFCVNSTCPGACVAGVRPGESLDGGFCQFGLEAVGPNQTCMRMPVLGEPCDPGFATTAHCLDSQCDPLTKRCVPLGDEGEPCSSQLGCGGFTFCVGDTCRRGALVGEACLNGSIDICAAGAFCGPNGRCQRWGQAGAACTERRQCEPELRCHSAEGADGGVCVGFAAVGESCAAAPCDSTSWCDPGGRVCRPFLAVGQACGGALGCEFGCGFSGSNAAPFCVKPK